MWARGTDGVRHGSEAQLVGGGGDGHGGGGTSRSVRGGRASFGQQLAELGRGLRRRGRDPRGVGLASTRRLDERGRPATSTSATSPTICTAGRVLLGGSHRTVAALFAPSLPPFPRLLFNLPPHRTERKRGPLNLIPLFFLPCSTHVLRAGPRRLAVLRATRVASPRPCLA
jgi:hypothetical protein